jgi:hypothetical protein
MSLSDLAAIGSFVTGVAVVITLMFLTLQLRQSTLGNIGFSNGNEARRLWLQNHRKAAECDLHSRHYWAAQK